MLALVSVMTTFLYLDNPGMDMKKKSDHVTLALVMQVLATDRRASPSKQLAARKSKDGIDTDSPLHGLSDGFFADETLGSTGWHVVPKITATSIQMAHRLALFEDIHGHFLKIAKAVKTSDRSQTSLLACHFVLSILTLGDSK